MRKLLPFILILIMLAIILGFSSQSGYESNGLSKSISYKIETILREQGSNNYDAKQINFILRKLAHFIEYLIFAVLLATGFNNLFKRIIPSILLSGLIGIGVAFLDEWVQSLSISRTSSLFDVMIDGLGVAAGLGAITLFTFLSKLNKV